MKIINKFVILLFCTVKWSIIFAAAIPQFFVSIDPAWVMGNPGKTQEINIEPGLGNIYLDQTGTRRSITVSPGIGLRSYQNGAFQINTALRFVPVSSMSLHGQIWQLKSPLFNDLGYQLQAKTNALLFDNMISWRHHCWQPGIILGLGVSRNTTKEFHEISLTDTAFPSLQTVNGASVSRMATELGAALDYSMEPIIFEFAYRYINAGTGQLQSFPLQNTTDVFSTGKLKYHMISLGIRAYYEV